jgi:PAS domain S-box-containing protein
VLYLQFWNSFCKQWNELAETGEHKRDSYSLKTRSTKKSLPLKEKYEYLTEYGTQILCFLHNKRGCTYLSRNFESLTGQSAQRSEGNNFYNLVHEDFRERLSELLTSGFAEHSPYPFRCKLRHGDGKHYWYLFLLHPKQDGKKGEYVCIMENINDHMLIQNSLQKSRMEAELALRARSEFLANMSHELRTPLNAVIGFAQIIESGIFGKVENQQYMEYIKHIHESGYDLLSKIEDLLEIASIDAGQMTLSQEEIYVHDILNQVIEAQSHHASAAQVNLEILSQSMEILVFVDRLKLQHILGHLVSNAIRCSHVGGTIALNAVITDDGLLEISVHDTGIGMPENKLNAIVMALQEDNCWTTGDNRSIGLGLALTREFVTLHGGQVRISSRAGAGTSITLTLPDTCIRSSFMKRPDYLQAVS